MKEINKFKIKSILLVIIIIIALILGFIAIAPTNMDFNSEEFNAKNALENLQVISKTQHSVFHYENHEKVRSYLLEKSISYVKEENIQERNYLTKNNKNPQTTLDGESIVYTESDIINEIDTEYDIRNILVQIPGDNEMGILLVAHYDSRGNIKRAGELAESYGAGDDGYGVVTLLEIMRYFSSSDIHLTNSIYFLFADGEETGRYGSLLESHNTELMDKVNFVINVEGRGMNGAAYMFETSKKNNKVIELYRNAKDKVSYSVAPAVYSVMTNFTDFMSFTEVGKQGLNFSTLDDINDYHVPSDNYENVNAASIQHYGSQIFPIVKEYVTNEKYNNINYFNGTHDMVFFNFLPDVFIIYSSTFSIIISIVLVILIILLLVFIHRKSKTDEKNKKIDYKELLKQIGFTSLGLLISIVSGLLLSLIVARLEGYSWSLTNVRSDNANIIFTSFIFILFMIFALILRKIRKDKLDYLIISSIIINTLLSLLTSCTLSGASFMFTVPALLGIIYLFMSYFLNEAKEKYKLIFFYLILFIIACIFVPLIASLLYAITIGGALALTMLAYLPYSLVLPISIIELNK